MADKIEEIKISEYNDENTEFIKEKKETEDVAIPMDMFSNDPPQTKPDSEDPEVYDVESEQTIEKPAAPTEKPSKEQMSSADSNSEHSVEVYKLETKLDKFMKKLKDKFKKQT